MNNNHSKMIFQWDYCLAANHNFAQEWSRDEIYGPIETVECEAPGERGGWRVETRLFCRTTPAQFISELSRRPRPRRFHNNNDDHVSETEKKHA